MNEALREENERLQADLDESARLWRHERDERIRLRTERQTFADAVAARHARDSAPPYTQEYTRCADQDAETWPAAVALVEQDGEAGTARNPDGTPYRGVDGGQGREATAR